MIQFTWRQLDSPIWHNITDYLDAKSVFQLSKTSHYFEQLLNKRREEIYKQICCRCHSYKLKHESWAEAFNQIPHRAVTPPFRGPKPLYSVFDPFESSSRFGFISDTHVIVTDFDVGKEFFRYFPINYDHAADDQVCLLMGGKILSVYYKQTQTLQIYDVDTQKLLTQQRFGARSYQCHGSVIDENRIFNVITRRFHELPGGDEYSLHYSCYTNGSQYYLVSAKSVFYAFSAEKESLTEVKFTRGSSTFYMRKANTVFFIDEKTTSYHHFPSGKTTHKDLKTSYGADGYTRIFDSAFTLQDWHYNENRSLYVYNERTAEWVRKQNIFKNVEFYPLISLIQYNCNDIQKVKTKRESEKEVYKCLYIHCEDGEVMYKIFDDEVDPRVQTFEYFSKLEEEIRTKWMRKRTEDDLYSVHL